MWNHADYMNSGKTQDTKLGVNWSSFPLIGRKSGAGYLDQLESKANLEPV